MAYEQRDGQGSLFKNDEKKTDKHPDYRGDCTIGGVKYWLSAWIKEGKNGKFMSLAIQPKQDGQGRQQPGKQEQDEDIPF
jgi:hypothetical protein